MHGRPYYAVTAQGQSAAAQGSPYAQQSYSCRQSQEALHADLPETHTQSAAGDASEDTDDDLSEASDSSLPHTGSEAGSDSDAGPMPVLYSSSEE